MLDLGAKRRLTGAVVLVVLAVVFLPMLLEEEAAREPVPEEELAIPELPPAPRGPQAEIFPSADEQGGQPGARLAEPSEVEVEPGPGPDSNLDETQESQGIAAGEAEPEPAPEQAQAPAGNPRALSPAEPDVGTRKVPAEAMAEQPKPSAPQTPGKPKPVPKGVTSWVVQVAAMSTPEAAARLEKKLRGNGFPAFVEKLEGTNRTLWRVRVGPEVERSRAKALAASIKQQTGLDVYVRKYGGG